MKKLLLTCLLMIATVFHAQITVGSGNTTSSTGPWSSCYGYSYHQMIYPQASIGASGTITSLSLTAASSIPTTATGGTPNTPQGTNTNFRVYIGHTTKANFASTSDWEPLANLTLVYDGTLTMPTTVGEVMTITLQTPFAYNNTDNLVIAFDENTAGYSCSYTWVANSGQTNMNLYHRSDTVNTDPASPPNGGTGTGRAATTPQVVLGGLVASSAPNCTTITAPANAATGVSATPTITWTSAGLASSYDLSIGTTPGGADVMPLTDVGNVTSYTVPATSALSYNTQYYVTVYPKNGIGSASGCTSNSFTTTSTVPCPTVTAPTTAQSGVSLTPTFTWNAGNSSVTGYTISIGTTSGGTDIMNNVNVGNVTSYTYSGTPALSNSTIYYYTVNAISGSYTSASCTVRNFTTLCASVNAPYTYDVEAAATTTNSTIGNCWSSNPSGTTSAFRWDVDGAGSTPSTGTGPSGAYSGAKYFYTEASSGALGSVAELLSPMVNVSALTNPSIQFYYHMFGATMGSLHVDVYDGTAWNNDLVVISGQQQTAEADAWTQQIVSLGSLTITGDIQVRFRGIRGSDFTGDMSLDDIAFVEAPSCLPPTGLQQVTTPTQATVSWTPPTPAPTSYDVYVDTTNTQPATATYTGVTGNSQVIPGTSGTTYYVWVVGNCGTSMSNVVGPITYTIPFPPPTNDECSSAASLSVSSTNIGSPITGNTAGATPSAQAAPACDTDGINDDVWYSFTATSTNHLVNVIYDQATNELVTAVYSGDCTTMTQVACFAGDYGNASVILQSLTIGQTYYVRIYTASNSTTVSEDFQISVTTPTTPTNDTCDTALALACNGTAQGSNAMATDDTLPTSTCGSTGTTASYKGVWFTVTAVNDGDITVSACGTDYDSYLRVYTGDCTTGLTCFANTLNVGYSDTNCGTPNVHDGASVTFSGVSGTTYYILLTGYAATRVGNYNIAVTQNCTTMGVSDVTSEESKVKVYPNPFTEILNIADVREVASVSITDMAGRVVKTIAKPTAQLQLGDLKSGMYLVTLKYKNGTVKSVKAIKK